MSTLLLRCVYIHNQVNLRLALNLSLTAALFLNSITGVLVNFADICSISFTVQSHYSQPAITSTGLPSSGTGSIQDPGSQTSSVGLGRPTFQGSLPLYRPGASLGPWGSSVAPTTTGGLSMPMYWQGYYGSTNGLLPQQQPFLQPPPGLSMPPSMPQSMQYPFMNMSLPTAASNFPASQLSENSPPLQPPFGTGPLNLQSSVLPVQSSTVVSDLSISLNPDSASSLTLPTVAPSSSLPLASQLSTSLDKSCVMLPLSDKPKAVSDPTISFKGVPDSASSTIGASAVLNDGMLPSLITPGQLLQPGVITASSSMSSQTAQKDVEVVHVSSPETTSASAPALMSAKAPAPVSAQVTLTVSAQPSPPLLPQASQPLKTGQEPILPSPSPSDLKVLLPLSYFQCAK